jgi:hypothetical protein
VQDGDWVRCHVLAPFADGVEQDDDESFLRSLLAYRGDDTWGKPEAMTVYLAAIKGDPHRVRGRERWFTALQARAKTPNELHFKVVEATDGRELHGKLLLLQVKRKYWAVMGSPNPTRAAYRARNRNVEVAVVLDIEEADFLKLLPASRPAKLEELRFEPPSAGNLRSYDVLARAVYVPRRRAIRLMWLEGVEPSAARISLDDRECRVVKQRWIENVDLDCTRDRHLVTYPRDPANKARSAVPLEVPLETGDLGILVHRSASLEELLAEEADPMPVKRQAAPVIDAPREPKDGVGRVSGNAEFNWRRHSRLLHDALQALRDEIEHTEMQLDVAPLQRKLERLWHAAPESDHGPYAASWRDWVRMHLWRLLEGLDRRPKRLAPLRQLAKRWRRELPAKLVTYARAYGKD